MTRFVNLFNGFGSQAEKRQKKDLRNFNMVLYKVLKRNNKIVFKRVAQKEKMCVIGVSDASYHQEDLSVAGVMKIIGNK